MRELEHFYNDGFGWICKHCEEVGVEADEAEQHSRLLREGEAEGRNPRLSTTALAKWSDEKREALRCPNCGAEEKTSGR